MLARASWHAGACKLLRRTTQLYAVIERHQRLYPSLLPPVLHLLQQQPQQQLRQLLLYLPLRPTRGAKFVNLQADESTVSVALSYSVSDIGEQFVECGTVC